MGEPVRAVVRCQTTLVGMEGLCGGMQDLIAVGGE
jgi:hypothetical protein